MARKCVDTDSALAQHHDPVRAVEHGAVLPVTTPSPSLPAISVKPTAASALEARSAVVRIRRGIRRFPSWATRCSTAGKSRLLGDAGVDDLADEDGVVAHFPRRLQRALDVLWCHVSCLPNVKFDDRGLTASRETLLH